MSIWNACDNDEIWKVVSMDADVNAKLAHDIDVLAWSFQNMKNANFHRILSLTSNLV